MKKTMFAVLIALLGLGIFTGVASAKTTPVGTGLLHDYIVQAAADELGLPVADVEAALLDGDTLYQLALDNGIVEDDLPAFLKDVRTAAVEAALVDGVITEDQAERMLLFAGRGMGRGTMRGGFGTGLCDGTGIPVGAGMRYGGRGMQVTP